MTTIWRTAWRKGEGKPDHRDHDTHDAATAHAHRKRREGCDVIDPYPIEVIDGVPAGWSGVQEAPGGPLRASGVVERVLGHLGFGNERESA